MQNTTTTATTTTRTYEEATADTLKHTNEESLAILLKYTEYLQDTSDNPVGPPDTIVELRSHEANILKSRRFIKEEFAAVQAYLGSDANALVARISALHKDIAQGFVVMRAQSIDPTRGQLTRSIRERAEFRGDQLLYEVRQLKHSSTSDSPPEKNTTTSVDGPTTTTAMSPVGTMTGSYTAGSTILKGRSEPPTTVFTRDLARDFVQIDTRTSDPCAFFLCLDDVKAPTCSKIKESLIRKGQRGELDPEIVLPPFESYHFALFRKRSYADYCFIVRWYRCLAEKLWLVAPLLVRNAPLEGPAYLSGTVVLTCVNGAWSMENIPDGCYVCGCSVSDLNPLDPLERFACEYCFVSEEDRRKNEFVSAVAVVRESNAKPSASGSGSEILTAGEDDSVRVTHVKKKKKRRAAAAHK